MGIVSIIPSPARLRLEPGPNAWGAGDLAPASPLSLAAVGRVVAGLPISAHMFPSDELVAELAP